MNRPPKEGATKEIAAFIAKYTPRLGAQLRGSRRKLRALIPRGYEFVYDNYNALVFAFGPSERPSSAMISVAGYPEWVTLFFLPGTRLKDPHQLLQESGSKVRSVRLASPRDLDTAPVRALIKQALARLAKDFAKAPKLSTQIRVVSAKQRPRRP